MYIHTYTYTYDHLCQLCHCYQKYQIQYLTSGNCKKWCYESIHERILKKKKTNGVPNKVTK